MRRASSWYLIYNRDLTDRLEISMGVSTSQSSLLFGIRYTGSSGITPRSSSFKEGSRFGLGVSGEEVYVISWVDWEGIWVEYHSKGSKVGNSRGLLESEPSTSRGGG